MKRIFFFLLASAGLLASASAQTAVPSGRIQYEGTTRIDMSQVRIVVDGQQIKPGSPDFPTDIPDSRTFGMTLSFAGGYAKEEREGGAVMRIVEGPGQAPQTTNLGRPFEEAVYLNLTERAYTTLLTVKKDDKPTQYRSSTAIGKASGWQLTDQTKKIAGYTCRKATVPYQKGTYTVWFTTDLPFTYSPLRDLTPEKGVVLAVEGPDQQYRASKVDLKPVAQADVRPNEQAQVVTPEEMKELREKAMADFRQRRLENLRGLN